MINIAVFSTKAYDREFLTLKSDAAIEWKFIEAKLTDQTAILAKGNEGVCVFVNDILNEDVLKILKNNGIKYIVLRCAGFNNIDIQCAHDLGFKIARVPKYSPEAVAEHTLALILSLTRKLHKAYQRVRENNFSLDGLIGSNLHGKTVGIIGTGAIGMATIKPLLGFGMKVLCYDPTPAILPSGADYSKLEEVIAQSDIISLHCPLNFETHHLINKQRIEKMKDGVMIINTSRGALLDTVAIIQGLKHKKIGALGIDVYEQEGDLFFEDLSQDIIQDDIFQRLLTFPNVLITGHQAFFTKEAMNQIAETTIFNILSFHKNQSVHHNLL